jgi:PAS domain S-box-containing protein
MKVGSKEARKASANATRYRKDQTLKAAQADIPPVEWDEAGVLAAIVQSSDDAIISKDLNGIIRSWNKGAERIFGYTAEEAVGKPVSMLAVPERVEEIPDIIERIRRGEKVDHYNTQRQTKDGRVLDISLTVSPLRDASGAIIGASKVARDVTLQKYAAVLQERLAAIVESSDDVIISKDLNGIIQSWNRGAERIFGYTAEEAIGKPVSMLAVPERVEEIPNIIERIRRGEKVDHYNTQRQTKDGRVLDISLTVSPLRDASGAIIGASKVARDVTDEKRRAELQERLAAIVQSSDDAIISKDLSGIIRSWNNGAERIFGYTAEEAIGKPVSMLAVPERVEEIPNIIERIRRGEKVDHYETKRQAKDGRILNISLTVSPIRNAAGEIIGASKIARDITEWKHAEQALRASEARFRAAVNAVSSIIWTNDAEGRMLGEQPGWVAFTGQTTEEVQGYGWATSVHPEDAHPTIVAWKEAVRECRPFIFEHRVRRHDGVSRLFSIRAVPVVDDAGAIREWVGVHTDITEERALMEARTLALKREHEARQTAELLNKVGPMLAAELDTPSLTQKVTDLATQLVGAQFGALFHNVENEQGESYLLYTISGVPREQFSKFPMPRNTQVFGPTFAGHGIVRSDDITKDPRYGQNPPYRGMPKGHLPVRSYIAVPVLSRSSEVLGGLFFGHEKIGVFTEQHEALLTGIAAQAAIALDNARLFADSQRAREVITRSNEELRRANSDLEQFAYSASHDLKEPLRVVAIYSQILQRKYGAKLDANANEYLEKVLAGAQRMDRLVQDLLAYTRSSAPADSSDAVSSVDAQSVFEQAIMNLAQSIQDSGAKIEKGALPTLRVSEVHLMQLFQNLIENAIKYRGNTPPQIRVQATREQDLWRICIHDNGIGIAPEYQEQVFGIFKRLHTSDRYSGTGIGLAICQRLVLRYGGRIWVESEGEGKGSTFCFTLPAGELNS